MLFSGRPRKFLGESRGAACFRFPHLSAFVFGNAVAARGNNALGYGYHAVGFGNVA